MTTKQLAKKIARELFDGMDADLSDDGVIMPRLERWMEPFTKDRRTDPVRDELLELLREALPYFPICKGRHCEENMPCSACFLREKIHAAIAKAEGGGA